MSLIRNRDPPGIFFASRLVKYCLRETVILWILKAVSLASIGILESWRALSMYNPETGLRQDTMESWFRCDLISLFNAWAWGRRSVTFFMSKRMILSKVSDTFPFAAARALSPGQSMIKPFEWVFGRFKADACMFSGPVYCLTQHYTTAIRSAMNSDRCALIYWSELVADSFCVMRQYQWQQKRPVLLLFRHLFLSSLFCFTPWTQQCARSYFRRWLCYVYCKTKYFHIHQIPLITAPIHYVLNSHHGGSPRWNLAAL